MNLLEDAGIYTIIDLSLPCVSCPACRHCARAYV